MKSSWKKQRQAAKKRKIKCLRIKHRLIKRYAPNIETFIKLFNGIKHINGYRKSFYRYWQKLTSIKYNSFSY
ncbi:hypothetical protein DS38502_32 [Lactococcus phage 38502]|nr:hypothetical protein DS38502_32 [Lactococcus phage 38502]